MRSINTYTSQQKALINIIEQIYITNPNITQKDFITSLGFLINKHKKKTK